MFAYEVVMLRCTLFAAVKARWTKSNQKLWCRNLSE